MDPRDNRPRARDKNVTSGGSGVHRRGDGLGTGPVGQGGSSSGGGSGLKRAAAGGGGVGLIILILALVMGGGNSGGGSGLLGSLLSSDTGSYLSEYTQQDSANTPSSFGFGDHSLAGNIGTNGTSGSNYTATSGTQADTSVASGSRAKRTVIRGGGQDTVTLMVYMCGTDLESKYGMGTNDLKEMAGAKFGDNINIIVYTGGCNQWRTSGISSSVNQIYQVVSGGMKPLVTDDGAKSMTEPATLSNFIQYCDKNFPADRYELILWDHGGGSVSGYGYDEKYKSKGSMSLAGLDTALRNGGVTFDFIGFDACLMATAETALMLDSYADYMVASEETEPGIGWYYTNWLSKLGQNTSMSTVEMGKNIVDDFVTECARSCPGQKATLSVIDLAEFAHTVPSDLADFSKSVSALIKSDAYKTVSDARYATREFAQSSKIDQVDLVDLAERMGTPEGKALAESLRGAVKYDRTSTNMSNAYGVSIFFPCKRTSYVDKAVNTYNAIGMDSEYAKCISEAASMQVSGQAAAGGTGSPIGSLFDIAGSLTGTSSSTELIGSLLSGFLSSGRGIEGLDSSNIGFMSDRALSTEETADYIALHHFDTSYLQWQENGGVYTMSLPDEQWELVHQLDLNMFYDDGTGYVDLGYDNLYSFNENGELVADTDRNWISINGNPVAYYHTDTTEVGDAYTISGYVPALLNGERVNLILVFDNDHPNGYVAGATTDYVDGETDTVAKSLTELQNGDTLDFLCDYYSYDQEYLDSYMLGEQITVSGDLTISNTDVGDGAVRLMYRFTDIYEQSYWTPAITVNK